MHRLLIRIHESIQLIVAVRKHTQLLTRIRIPEHIELELRTEH